MSYLKKDAPVAVVIITTSVLFIEVILTNKYSLGLFGEHPKELIDEVWQVINYDYYDSAFNQTKWDRTRKEYLSRRYSSKKEAYQAIEEMLGSLKDPYTRLMNQEDFNNFNNESSVYYSYQDGGIGYLRLSKFNSTTTSEMKRAVLALNQQKVTSYILDLRSNQVGTTNTSIDVARLWLKQGTIGNSINRNGDIKRSMANNTQISDKPLVILVNQKTANSSEILAAALQDNGRAKIIGSKTSGNGLWQSVKPLESGVGIIISVARFRRPNGEDLYQKGIKPDVEVQFNSESIKQADIGTIADPQYVAATQFLRPEKQVQSEIMNSVSSPETPSETPNTRTNKILSRNDVSKIKSSPELYKIANKTTVRINGQNPGSGVVIGQTENTYYVLTAKHVVSTPDEYEVVTSDNKQHSIQYNLVKKIPELDLAIVEFSSQESYDIAVLGNSDQIELGSSILLSGWTTPDDAINDAALVIDEGKISSIKAGNNDGYELVYGIPTTTGMSGGPVIDNRGLVIGIHGRASGNQERGKNGINLGMPINLFINNAQKTGLNLENLRLSD